MSSNALEARLIISADDKTGNAFSAVADRLRMLERVAKSVQPKIDAVSRAATVAARTPRGQGPQGAASPSRASRSRSPTATVIRDAIATAAPYAAPALALPVVTSAERRFSEVERAMTRVGLTADATAEETRVATRAVAQMAIDTAVPFDKVRAGLEALVAQGKTLPQAMALLPAVVKTAQAAGAEAEDIAKSAGALGTHLGIGAADMQKAFDTLVKAGNLGQFELKDMARYLPSMAAAANAIGLKGPDGLKRMAATLQIIREGSGTAEEAASSAQNIFAKMESDETIKNFKEFGIDLEEQMKKARKEGKDLLSVFTDLTKQALKGDVSKIPRLFADMELARGMRALVTGKGRLEDFVRQLKNVDGATVEQLNRVLDDSQAKIDRMAASWDRLKTKFGEALSPLAVPVMNAVSETLQGAIDDAERASRGEQTTVGATSQILWNYLTTGQPVNQPAADLEKAHADKVFRDRYDDKRDALRATIEAIDASPNAKRLGQTRSRADNALKEMDAAAAAHDETALQLVETVAGRQRINRARINNPGAIRPPGYGVLGFGIHGPGSGGSTFGPGYDDPYGLPPSGSIPLPPTGRPASPPPMLKNLDDVLSGGKIKAEVTGPVTAELKGSAAITSTITISPSPLFFAHVTQYLEASGHLQKAAGNEIGSTGKSQPDTGDRK